MQGEETQAELVRQSWGGSAKYLGRPRCLQFTEQSINSRQENLEIFRSSLSSIALSKIRICVQETAQGWGKSAQKRSGVPWALRFYSHQPVPEEYIEESCLSGGEQIAWDRALFWSCLKKKQNLEEPNCFQITTPHNKAQAYKTQKYPASGKVKSTVFGTENLPGMQNSRKYEP